MKTLQINGVSFIPNDKNGNPINIFVLKRADGKPAIVRSASEFVTDLKETGLIGLDVTNFRHPKVNKARAYMNQAPCVIRGEVLDAKQGDKWTVRENSSVITNPNHPQHGEVSVGDQLEYKSDMSIVTEGFLTISLNPQVQARLDNAEALADAQLAQLNSFDMSAFANDAVASSSEEVIDTDEIPDDVANEAIAAAESQS